MGSACSSYGERRDAYRVLVGKPEGKRQFGRLRLRWEDNIRINIQKVGWGAAWTGLIWLRTGVSGGCLWVTKLRVLSNSGNFLTV